MKKRTEMRDGVRNMRKIRQIVVLNAAPRRRNGGFSLLEVVIALVVLTFSMITVMTMIIQASTTQQIARETETAKEAAMAQLAKVRMSLFADVPSFQGSTFVVSGLNDARQSDQQSRGTVSIDMSNPDLYDVLVTVNWKGKKGVSSYSMRTLCAR